MSEGVHPAPVTTRPSGPALRRALRTVTVAWMFGVVWLAAASGGHFRVLARMVGFSNFAFGLLVALPFAATFGQLVSAFVIERTGRLKGQFLYCAAGHRLLWLAAAAVPLVLPIPSTVAVASMLVILVTSWFLQALAVPAWMTWMGALVPRRIRGRYFAARERLAIGVQIVAVVVFGLLMDRAYDPTAEGIQGGAVWVVSAILAVGAVFGTIDILLFGRVPEVVPRPREEGSAAEGEAKAAALRSLLRFVFEPLRDRVFRHYVLYAATLTFSMTVGGWFFWLNAVDNLGFSNLTANVLFLAVSPLAGMWSVGYWGRAIDRWGRRPVLIVCTAGASACLVLWLVIAPDTPTPEFVRAAAGWAGSGVGRLLGRPEWGVGASGAPLGVYVLAAAACVLGGATWSGISLAQTGIVLGFADGSGQSRHVAASSLLISTGGVLGGLAGGAIAQTFEWLQAEPWRVGPFLWNNWHMTFAVAFAARALTILWLVHMPDPRAGTVRSLARYMGTNVYNGIVTRLFYSVRVFGWRQPVKRARPTAPPEREGGDA